MSERARFDSVQVGDVLPERTFPLQRADLVRYAGASGDFNPIHWNPRVATEVGLPDVIAHGMLTMATAVRLVSDWCGDPGAVLDYGTRFTNPVVVPDDGVGAEVTVAGTVAARDEVARTVRVDLVVTCLGERVLGKAQAVVRLP
ncbi:MAG: MaoC/PaaZ C-terminal domain-containing protein [Kineosporiaceae bacterium]